MNQRLVRALRSAYFDLSVIIGTQPNIIANGQTIDANPVQANFAWIIAQVNANAAPLSSVPAFTGITAFTPDIKFGGANVGMTYAFRAGAYFKISSLVLFALDIKLTAKGGSVGIATVENLPFPVSAAFPTGGTQTCHVTQQFVTFAAGYAAGVFNAGGTNLTLVNCVTAANYNVVQDVQFANNSEITITGIYAS